VGRGWRGVHARPGHGPRSVAAAVALLLTLGLALPALAAPAESPGLRVKVLSNRADLLSGGDALVEVVLPTRGTVPPGLAVKVDGRDVTRSFAVRRNGRFVGLVTGLRVGRNVLTVRARGLDGVRLVLTNHPVGGPIFAGPQVQPWRCATEENGLGPPRDAQCNTPAVYKLFYRSVRANAFRPFDPTNPPPKRDIAQTTTDQGHTVPYIVRRERGVIDRGIYDIAVLYQPGAPWRPWAPQRAWNRKLLWTFGGSCQPFHAQNPPDERPDPARAPGVMHHRALSRGFAVASSGMSVLGNNCNTVVSAEALMMIKEHLIERYGPVRYTFGIGGSGGSMQQVQIADAYPGLLDGIVPHATFADLLTTVTETFDCRLLTRYFSGTPTQAWDPDAIQAVVGHGSPSTCRSWVATFGYPAMFGDPTIGCTTPVRTYRETRNGAVRTQDEAPWVYDPISNPGGVRCTIFDYMSAIFGHRQSDGFAGRPYDNIGVQYGLQALLDGRISAEQFVDLNATVGSMDIDYRFQPTRVAADPAALTAAYRSGQVTSGRALSRVPIVDASFSPADGDIHTAFHAWKLRDRLTAANGSAANHVIRQAPGGRTPFRLMDRWLTRIERDAAPGTPAARVVRNKPAAAVDSGAYGGTNPRVAAGAPLRDDILKCRLQPLTRTAYGAVSFTDEQWARLQAAFGLGVCDWTRPGVGQTTTVPWASYAGGGLSRLGPAPKPTVLPARR
jgi:hypothetical protein